MTETKTRTRTCDNCGTDLTMTDDAYGWHYTLSGEFTPSRAMIGYDPHPEPPEDRHFCDMECLAAWTGHQFDDPHVSYNMFDVGGDMLAKTGTMGSIGNYAEQRRFAIELFTAMWKARPSSIGNYIFDSQIIPG